MNRFISGSFSSLRRTERKWRLIHIICFVQAVKLLSVLSAIRLEDKRKDNIETALSSLLIDSSDSSSQGGTLERSLTNVTDQMCLHQAHGRGYVHIYLYICMYLCMYYMFECMWLCIFVCNCLYYYTFTYHKNNRVLKFMDYSHICGYPFRYQKQRHLSHQCNAEVYGGNLIGR